MRRECIHMREPFSTTRLSISSCHGELAAAQA